MLPREYAIKIVSIVYKNLGVCQGITSRRQLAKKMAIIHCDISTELFSDKICFMSNTEARVRIKSTAYFKKAKEHIQTLKPKEYENN